MGWGRHHHHHQESSNNPTPSCSTSASVIYMEKEESSNNPTPSCSTSASVIYSQMPAVASNNTIEKERKQTPVTPYSHPSGNPRSFVVYPGGCYGQYCFVHWHRASRSGQENCDSDQPHLRCCDLSTSLLFLFPRMNIFFCFCRVLQSDLHILDKWL